MSEATVLEEPYAESVFHHEAFLYAGLGEFLDGTLFFIRDSQEAGEPVLVVVSEAKIELLRSELNDDDFVQFADMTQVGVNPARIIPLWQQFVGRFTTGGRRVRGIGEPVWAERSPAELVECQRHESLLNLAFEGAPGWWLMCPYDTETLGPAVLAEADRTHPFLFDGTARRTSPDYQSLEAVARPFDAPLPDPPAVRLEVRFDRRNLEMVRTVVSNHARTACLDSSRAADLVLAAHELAANSVRHGGGAGTLRVWQEADATVCEVRDEGRIDAPMAGRERPAADQDGGRGLWMVNQLCDLVQIRSFSDGLVIRLHMRRR